MPKSATKLIVFQPEAHQAMLRGIDQISTALRCTLGPSGGHVVIDHIFDKRKPPEVLDSGGIIARRVIQLADRDEDIGAMLARAMIHRQHEQYGDGTATAAVLFQTIIKEGLRYVAAGGNAMLLRHHLQAALPVARQELDRMRFQVAGQEQLAQVAESICHDPELAGLLGEIFDTIGEYGQFEVRKSYERGLKRDYVVGMYWQQGLHSRQMIADTCQMRTELENAHILISDFEIKHAQDLLPVLEAALGAGITSLVIVARSLSEQAIGFLLTNSSPDRLQVIAVKSPGDNADDRMAGLEDLAILTGGTPLLKIAGQSLASVTVQDFGQARRFWATHQTFGLAGGKGNARTLNRHIMRLQSQFASNRDGDTREKLQQRIGKLMGGSATLWVGGATDTEITVRQARAERTARAVRVAIRDGVLLGAGMALFNCHTALDQAAACATGPDERAAFRILGKAVQEPARAIIANAGHDSSAIMARIIVDEGRTGFDALSGQVVNLVDTGLLDAAAVQKGALNNAVATAAMALSIDVIAHRRQPDMAETPEGGRGIRFDD
jgi:chaperonin GroEL